MTTKVPCFAALCLAVTAGFLAAQASPQTPAQQFTVLRTDHFNAGAETLTSGDADCSITGAGSGAEMECRRAGTAKGSYHFNTALVVDPNGKAYVIACRVPLVLVLCRKLNPGIVVEGRMDNGILALTDGSKVRRYQILASANIGPVPVVQAPPAPARSPAQVRSQPPPTAAPAPPVNRPSEKPQTSQAEPSENSSAACSTASAACVTFVSEPSGAEIYVDGKFMGNTPSMIILPAGSHELRITADKFASWTRTLEASAGNKVTIRATLQSQR